MDQYKKCKDPDPNSNILFFLNRKKTVRGIGQGHRPGVWIKGKCQGGIDRGTGQGHSIGKVKGNAYTVDRGHRSAAQARKSLQLLERKLFL